MPGQNISKGNPAHVRASNTRKKEHRHQLWLAGERRKQLRIQLQEARASENLRLLKAGRFTPWQEAEALRAELRLATCGSCRVVFEDKKCPVCEGSFNLRDMWQKRHAEEPLTAA